MLLLKYVCLKRLYIHFISESGQPLLVDTQQDFKFCFDKKIKFARQTFHVFLEKEFALMQLSGFFSALCENLAGLCF